ncbi:MAG: coproporphyrinogen III oxidase, partial [Bacilli bacterium]|nr:coproporphyrinogen III oxidase [Bacilli bacterium]
MSFLTSLARSWLTRSLKPFTFKSDYDQVLPYENLDNLGLYVHLPFCKSICNFCPSCKKLYSEEESNRYIDALIKEIHLVGSQSEEKK